VRRLLILAGVSVPVIAGVVVLIIILAKRKRELICMRISDILGMTFKNLMRRKIRTLLTLTGVLIGTTSIAVMMSIGVGMDRAFESQFSRMEV